LAKAVHRQATTEARSALVIPRRRRETWCSAVDRHHHDVQPADRRELAVVEPGVQMAEMADAKAAIFEDEDRVAVL